MYKLDLIKNYDYEKFRLHERVHIQSKQLHFFFPFSYSEIDM